MNPIQLTDEHKSKLLEMCKILFPECDFFVVNHTGYLCGTYGQSTDGIAFHWFEFCMTHLSTAISKLKDYPSDMIDRNEFTKTIIDNQYKYHPIDYLYAQFKELRLKQ